MKQALNILAAAVAFLALAGQAAFSNDNKTTPWRIGNANLQVTIDKTTGLPTDIETRQRRWFTAPVTMTVKRETTGATASPADGSAVDDASVRASLSPLGLAVSSRWSQDHDWLVWDLDFTGETQRTGHEVILDLPVLAPSLRIFTPSDRGVLDLAMHPTFKPVPYGVYQCERRQRRSLRVAFGEHFRPGKRQRLDHRPAARRQYPAPASGVEGRSHLAAYPRAPRHGRRQIVAVAHPVRHPRGRLPQCAGSLRRPLSRLFRDADAARRSRRRLLVSPHPGASGFRGNGTPKRALHLVFLLVHPSWRISARGKGVVPLDLRQVVEPWEDDERSSRSTLSSTRCTGTELRCLPIST